MAKPMEWAYKMIATTTGAVDSDRIALGLRDDEIAEIHGVQSGIEINQIVEDDADDQVSTWMYLSMDPDAEADPASDDAHEDLETFYEDVLRFQTSVGAAGQDAVVTSKTKTAVYSPPLLVGTDVGIVGIGLDKDSDIERLYWARLYFTRRKATAPELNQILLKRR